MKLSDGEKLILLLLTDMYKRLKINGDFDPDFISHTIHHGHLWGFNWEYASIPFEPAEDPPEVSETVNYLTMWSSLEESFENLSTEDQERLEDDAGPFGSKVSFPGFDDRNEPHSAITTYLIDRLGRFSRFKGRSNNSHSKLVPDYAQMYAVFEPLQAATMGERTLTLEEMTEVLNARQRR